MNSIQRTLRILCCIALAAFGVASLSTLPSVHAATIAERIHANGMNTVSPRVLAGGDPPTVVDSCRAAFCRR